MRNPYTKNTHTKMHEIAYRLLIPLFLFISAILWYPMLWKYQDFRYDRDWSKYTAEKAAYDSTEDARVAHLEDSLFAAWPTVNDTALRKVDKVTKSYDLRPVRQYEKTERTRCRNADYGDYIECEPVWDWVVKRYESVVVYDTTWTKGYRNRQHWLNTARSSAHNEAMRQRVAFRDYDGFPFHKYTRDGTEYWWLVIVYIVWIFGSIIVSAILREKNPSYFFDL